MIGAAMRAHTVVGPGLLESACETCLAYDDLPIENGYRFDLLVENLGGVEVKAVEAILPIHRGQLLGYLRLENLQLGYLLNFHVPHMRDGIVRTANGL
jgi:GxxExxY protein